MFGSEYSRHPEILMYSFGEMKDEYARKAKKQKGINSFFHRTYVSIFGIPEIGFQIRSLYFKKILGKIRKDKVKRILDAGSGIGIYSIWLANNFPKAKVVGCEIDKNKLKFSGEFRKELNINNLEFIYGDVTKKIDGKYDLIVNIDVLEHVKDYKSALKNFHSLLNPGGYLYIHTPQPNQQRIFKSLEKWHHEDHVREGYAPGELTKTLRELGFKVVEMRETFGFFGKLSWELNHLAFEKGFIVDGIVYPFLYLLSLFDIMIINKEGLGTTILVKKNEK